MKYLDKLVLLLNLAVVIMTFLAYLAPSVNPNYTWIISFFGLFYPLFIIAHFVIICYWLIRKRSRIWISVLTLAIGFKHFITFIPFNSTHEESQSEYVNVLSYNISNALYAYPKDKTLKAQRKQEFIGFLQSFADVDIFCLQEVGEYGNEIIHKAFQKGYHVYHKDKGATIVSKHPILNKGEIEFGTKTNSCLWADIKLPFDTVRVYSFHLQSNQISKDAQRLANQQEIDQKQAWYDIKGMLRKFKNKHLRRTKQANLISNHAQKSPYKIILGGDLNDPPQSYTYNIMTQLGRDAFKSAGYGLGSTYQGVIPLLRIDYLFVDPKVKVHHCEVIKDNNFSDHFPLLSSLNWPGT
jgi:endonuclease/exonuclease/phosphatase family metal-dependent hydrolase